MNITRFNYWVMVVLERGGATFAESEVTKIEYAQTRGRIGGLNCGHFVRT